ncbi:MAG: hypothetical protein GC192_19895 [Bacteroidetes bacterium]|nr:hypothetical protein [Bacteroidota bacterium]
MKTRIVKTNFVLLAIFALISFNSCASSTAFDEDLSSYQPHSDQSLFMVMNNNQQMLEMTIVTELDSLLQKRKNVEYQAADFSFVDEKGILHNFQANIKPRGKFRRMTCDFPPLKLKFSKKELEAAGLNEMNELKLVTHCVDDKDVSKGLVLREYLAYKLYNEMTPHSLRVQLARITYIDKNNPDTRISRLGFVIEDEEELSWRTNSDIVKTMGTKPIDLSPSHEKIASVFQYMIGNTDWSIEMLRNVELLHRKDGSLVPVPYDFDFSGVVGAPYARPNVDVGQRRVGERVFMGAAKSSSELYATLSYFRSKKSKLLDIVNDFSLLDNNDRLAIKEYIEGFYEEIDTQESAQYSLFEKNSIANGMVLPVKGQ